MYRLVCLTFFVSGALGQVVKLGLCDYAAIGGFVADLNLTAMFGTWNQIARLNNAMEKGECSSLAINGKYNADGTLANGLAYHLEVVNKTKTYHNGTIAALSPSIDGMFVLNMTDFLTGSFVVQATNYTDYAVLYSCHQLTVASATQNNTKVVMAWQFHRKPTISSSEQASITEIINRNPDLNGTEWKVVSHSDTACGNTAVSLAVPHVLIILATMFIGKGFVY